MKSALIRLITGQSFRQEYLCLASELRHPLKAYLLVSRDADPLNVTATHLFVGYKPLIIAFVYEPGHQVDHTKVCLCFTPTSFESTKRWKGFHIDTGSVANLLLTKKVTKQFGSSVVVFYEGKFGRHHFLGRCNQVLGEILLKFKKKAIGNVSLVGNLYDQVRIAYAIPRKIALITIADGELMNIFPTDLHGMINNNYYSSSLRISGEACKQVERIRRLVISDVDRDQYQLVYDLGKNHMQPMKPTSQFNLSNESSELFKFPLPAGTGSYKELEVLETFDCGIHRIFIYKIVHEKTLTPLLPLFHIHNYYAQWRKNNNLSSEYLLRVQGA